MEDGNIEFSFGAGRRSVASDTPCNYRPTHIIVPSTRPARRTLSKSFRIARNSESFTSVQYETLKEGEDILRPPLSLGTRVAVKLFRLPGPSVSLGM